MRPTEYLFPYQPEGRPLTHGWVRSQKMVRDFYGSPPGKASIATTGTSFGPTVPFLPASWTRFSSETGWVATGLTRYTLLNDRSGKIWIGADESLYEYDPETEHFNDLPFPRGVLQK